VSPPSPKGGSFNPLFVKRAGVILPYPSYMSCARVSITPNPHNPLQGRGTHQSFHRGAGVKPRFFVSLRITELSRPSCILPSGRGGIFISSTFSVVNSSVFIRVHLWLQNPPGPLQAGGIIYPPINVIVQHQLSGNGARHCTGYRRGTRDGNSSGRRPPGSR